LSAQDRIRLPLPAARRLDCFNEGQFGGGIQPDLGRCNPGGQRLGGQPLSNNSTLQDNGTKKNVYFDTAYGKWTALNSDGWLLSATIGKMYNPLQFTPMVFDPIGRRKAQRCKVATPSTINIQS
jgi:hypothetical protein